jgi:hypothetical protein
MNSDKIQKYKGTYRKLSKQFFNLFQSDVFALKKATSPTPLSGALGKLTVVQIDKFPTFYEDRMSVTASANTTY